MRQLLNTLTLATILLAVGSVLSADGQQEGNVANKSDYAIKLDKWIPRAERGEGFAQYIVGIVYLSKKRPPHDNKAAFKWLTLAANQEVAEAQYVLGYMYRKGIGVSPDYEKAIKWYSLAAEQGVAEAQYALGMMYEKGQGAARDYNTAVKWWSLAVEQGNTDAQNALETYGPRRWNFKADMNYSGSITTSDILLWIEWGYFYPGDGVIYFLINKVPNLGRFLEVSSKSYGGIGSAIISLIFWWFILLRFLGW